MSSDNERKDYRRKKLSNKKNDVKKKQNDYDDFSYSKIKNQYKQKRQSFIDQDTLDEIENYYE
jgi:hypothetical protein